MVFNKIWVLLLIPYVQGVIMMSDRLIMRSVACSQRWRHLATLTKAKRFLGSRFMLNSSPNPSLQSSAHVRAYAGSMTLACLPFSPGPVLTELVLHSTSFSLAKIRVSITFDSNLRNNETNTMATANCISAESRCGCFYRSFKQQILNFQLTISAPTVA